MAMAWQFDKLFRAPYSVPNGLQVTPEGLWIVDQVTDRVALVEMAAPNAYGVTMFLTEIPSESSNTSGLSAGDGALWLAANGSAEIWRAARPTDAVKGMGEILKVDPGTGRTLQRWPLPGGGGTHGLDYDRFEPGILWLTTLKSQTLTKVRIEDWQVLHTLSLPYGRAHGVVRVPDGIWVVHTSERVIVKLDTETGAELDRIQVPREQPEPHCLSAYGDTLLYCDATTGWIVNITS
jgi:hypothetical protein